MNDARFQIQTKWAGYCEHDEAAKQVFDRKSSDFGNRKNIADDIKLYGRHCDFSNQ